MNAREPSSRHSDLGPSSKDWQPDTPGRDEDFTPDKDLWTLSRKGDIGAGRPGEDVHAESAASSDLDGAVGGHQPGTQREGRSWHSRRPESGNEDDKLDQALKDSFPTSDPPQAAQPGVTGWDLNDEDRQSPGRWGRDHGRDSGPAGLRTAIPDWIWLVGALALVPVLISVGQAMQRSRRSSRQTRGSSGHRRD